MQKVLNTVLYWRVSEVLAVQMLLYVVMFEVGNESCTTHWRFFFLYWLKACNEWFASSLTWIWVVLRCSCFKSQFILGHLWMTQMKCHVSIWAAWALMSLEFESTYTPRLQMTAAELIHCLDMSTHLSASGSWECCYRKIGIRVSVFLFYTNLN